MFLEAACGTFPQLFFAIGDRQAQVKKDVGANGNRNCHSLEFWKSMDRGKPLPKIKG
jgi:hypothetical protein